MGAVEEGPQAALPGGSAVTIGAFDGVHLGHRRLIAELGRIAREEGLRSVVVTFDRHPAAVVRPESAPLLLTDLDQKLELLLAAGVDEVEVVPFDAGRAAESAEDFVEEVLVDELGARVVIVGIDFHFGHGRRGNVALLREMGETRGFTVVGFDLVGDPGDSGVVSSTRIRNLLAEGDVEAAAALLGRSHEVRGRIVAGAGAGHGADEGVAVEVPADIALPAPGRYVAAAEPAAAGRGDEGAGELLVLATVLPPGAGPRVVGGRRVELDVPAGAPAGVALDLAEDGSPAGSEVCVRFVARYPGGPEAAPSYEALLLARDRAVSGDEVPAPS